MRSDFDYQMNRFERKAANSASLVTYWTEQNQFDLAKAESKKLKSAQNTIAQLLDLLDSGEPQYPSESYFDDDNGNRHRQKFIGNVLVDNVTFRAGSSRARPHSRAKLSVQQVALIRRDLNSGYTPAEIATQYPVVEQTIKNIQTGSTWANIQPARARRMGENNHSAKLTRRDVSMIKFLIGEKRPMRKIASLYGVGYATVWDIKAGRTWNIVQPAQVKV